VYVQEVTCGPASTTSTKSTLRLVTSATLGEPGHMATWLEIPNSTCRGVQNSLKWCQCENWETSQHGITVVCTQQDKWCKQPCCDNMAEQSTVSTYSVQMIKGRLLHVLNVRGKCINSSASNHTPRSRTMVTGLMRHWLMWNILICDGS